MNLSQPLTKEPVTPYIPQNSRQDIDSDINALVEKIQATVEPYARDGALNYTVTRLLTETMKDPEIKGAQNGWRYGILERCIGILECCKLEFYRRLVAPYEDKCIEKHGDIDEYKFWSGQ